jgi:hypothetical protein
VNKHQTRLLELVGKDSVTKLYKMHKELANLLLQAATDTFTSVFKHMSMDSRAELKQEETVAQSLVAQATKRSHTFTTIQALFRPLKGG